MVYCSKIQTDKLMKKCLKKFASKQSESIKVNNNMIDYDKCVTIT
jgi:hypothetical protein